MGKREQSWWEKYKVDVPEGKSGDWVIERFTVSDADESFGRMRATFSFSSFGRYVSAGTYTALRRGGTMVMSDTRDEIRDQWEILHASGDVLINGLGLGVVARGCLLNPKVTSVTVVELSRDVIMLVEPWLKEIAKKANTPLTIIQADALTWQPPKGKRWGMVWHDIWDNICGDNLDDMHRLHRKYGRRCDRQGSWCRAQVERHR
jgi:hypothetical protein